MTKLLLLLLSLVTFVYSAHSDHADVSHAVVSAKDSSDGHHVREHSEDDHQRDTENGNVRSRNSDKHSDGMVALIDSMDDAEVDETAETADDEPAAVDTEDVEDDTEAHPDHETVQNEEDHPDHEAVQNEDDHPDHEDAGIIVDHPDHENVKEDDDAVDDDTEDHERTVPDSADEDADGDRTDLGELEYAGQGQGDERARGSFDRDEDIEGRHDTFETPQEVHEEDHEGLFGDDAEEPLDEEPQTESVDVEEAETDTEAVDEDDEEVVDEEETETEDVDVDAVDGVEIVGHLDETGGLETVRELEDVDGERTDLGELEYAGQGQGDERARGSFDRDEDIEGRHDTFESPQEDHVEPAHDDLHDEDHEDELVGEGDVVDERVIGDEQEDVEQAEASEEELVAVKGRMDRVKGSHFVMSTALLVVTGAAMAVLFVHLMTTWNAKKAVGHDPEYTPLIADKV